MSLEGPEKGAKGVISHGRGTTSRNHHSRRAPNQADSRLMMPYRLHSVTVLTMQSRSVRKQPKGDLKSTERAWIQQMRADHVRTGLPVQPTSTTYSASAMLVNKALASLSRLFSLTDDVNQDREAVMRSTQRGKRPSLKVLAGFGTVLPRAELLRHPTSDTSRRR